MMACKAELFGDLDIKERLLLSKEPKLIKALGRQVSNFDQELWDKFKHSIVLMGNWCKFSQNPDLADFLLSTHNRLLVEASPVDKIWGIGLAADHEDATNINKWRGLNLLGFALMEVRDEFKRVREFLSFSFCLRWLVLLMHNAPALLEAGALELRSFSVVGGELLERGLILFLVFRLE